MRERVFHFKQFSISHNKCAMKVGTDGVLLGAWCNTTENGNCLDIGTGSGLIAMMVAQRNQSALITAIDIEENAAIEAAENFEKCPWAARLESKHIDFKTFAENSNIKFDSIVSNPPFFINSLHSPDYNRTKARHTDSLTFNDLIVYSAKILNDDGCLSIITPADTEEVITNIALNAGLCITRKTYVHPTTDTQAKRILWEFSPKFRETTVEHITIEISRHIYTPEYIALTKDFYIKM